MKKLLFVLAFVLLPSTVHSEDIASKFLGIKLRRSDDIRFNIVGVPNNILFGSVAYFSPQTQEEKIAYAIGQHESANFKACPDTCQVSHNYWGRKAKSGGYMHFSSEEEAWNNQMDYLERRFFSKEIYSLQVINKTYAEDMGWSVKVQHFLDHL